MTDKNPAEKSSRTTDTSRRRLLKGLTVGGGAFTISEWSRPVVQSIVLPAHANGSPGEISAVGWDVDVSTSFLISWPDLP
jgi:hypothetical protein